jgi:tryptophan 2,3-dioxygenase
MAKEWKKQLGDILERLTALEDKYEGLGQDMLSYLEGLYYSNGLTYWDYIHLDSLLGLQNPRTPFRDEVIFITYHQVTELMFKLVKQEIGLIAEPDNPADLYDPAHWTKRLARANNYFRHLTLTFDLMMTGLDGEEVRKFRMALLPASGFQSVQYRHIEIMSTGLANLTREGSAEGPLEAVYQQIYWKKGGIDLESGQKTVTLRMFEEQYDESLIQLAQKYATINLAALYQAGPEAFRSDEGVVAALRSFDEQVNIFWKLAHLSAASRHLVSDGADIEATGGTNWRTFLPPRFQRIIFYPFLWTEQELDEWGKAGVVKRFGEQVTRHWMK